MSILIRGYYGAGNFGDDILSLVAYRAVTTHVARDRVALESHSDDYLPTLFGHPVRTVRPGADEEASTLVLGGGGLFYNFAGGSTAARPFEALLPLLGARTFGRAYDLLSLVRPGRTQRWRARNIAFGLGIGPFVPGSRNRVTAAMTLAHYDGIAVRDPVSLATLRAWGLADRAAQFTDIAFLRRFWMPRAGTQEPRPRRVGLVLRDWKHAPNFNSYLEALPGVVEALRARGVEGRLIAFDARQDDRMLRRLPLDAPPLVWDPYTMTLSQFCDELRAHDVIVSARAHGSIVGSCLGVPSICVAIEPKLEEVARMLEGSARIWRAPFAGEELLRLVDEALNDDGARRQVEEVVARNERVAERSLEWLGAQLQAR